jgi:hypothetical protein
MEDNSMQREVALPLDQFIFMLDAVVLGRSNIDPKKLMREYLTKTVDIGQFEFLLGQGRNRAPITLPDGFGDMTVEACHDTLFPEVVHV